MTALTSRETIKLLLAVIFINLVIVNAHDAKSEDERRDKYHHRSRGRLKHHSSSVRRPHAVKGLMEFKIPRKQFSPKQRNGSLWGSKNKESDQVEIKDNIWKTSKRKTLYGHYMDEIFSNDVEEKQYLLASSDKDLVQHLENERESSTHMSLPILNSGIKHNRKKSHKPHRKKHNHHHKQSRPPIQFSSKDPSLEDNSKTFGSNKLESVEAAAANLLPTETVKTDEDFKSSGENDSRNKEALTKLGVHVSNVHVPPYVARGADAKLECIYNLTIFSLYSLKWYRDDMEFFRYIPTEEPSKLYLPVKGVRVDLQRSTGKTVYILNVGNHSSGHYKCEVLSDAPEYYTADKSQEMMVIDLPEEKPHLLGMSSQYHIGERTSMTCVSAYSFPPAKLSWFVNDKKISSKFTYELSPLIDSRELVRTRLVLELPVMSRHFVDGKMTLKCSAAITSLSVSSREHVIEDRLTYSVPVMEARDSSMMASSADWSVGSSFRHSSLQTLSVLSNYSGILKLCLMFHFWNLWNGIS